MLGNCMYSIKYYVILIWSPNLKLELRWHNSLNVTFPVTKLQKQTYNWNSLYNN